MTNGTHHPTHDPAHATAEMMRDAASWLRLAADRLERGHLAEARNMQRLAEIRTDDAGSHLRELTEGGGAR